MATKEQERRYIVEYLLHRWPEGGWILNVPLGAIPDYLVQHHGLAKAAAYYRPTRPRVDAIMPTKSKYYLIETKVREPKQGIGDLAFYRGLIPTTPDLPYYTGQEIIYLCVVPWMISWVEEAGKAMDIEVDIYHRAWIDEYIQGRQHYYSAEYREARDKKLALRVKLGVD